MAELHKMTLYICDLEENLDMREAAEMIDRALNGVSGNAIIRCADVKTAKNRIEWDDDIDLNRRDCPTEQWEKYFHDGDGK